MQPMKRVCFQFDDDLMKKVAKHSEMIKGVNQSDIARAAVREWLGKYTTKPEKIKALDSELELRVGLRGKRKLIRHRQKKAALKRGGKPSHNNEGKHDMAP